MAWFNSNRSQNPDDNQGEFDPSKFQEEIKTSTKAEFEAFKTDMDSKLSGVSEMAEFIRSVKEERDRAAALRAQNNRNESLEVDDELAITNPLEAMRRMNQPALEQAQIANAYSMRREVLGEKEYYTGTFKEEVDRLVDSQPLALRSKPDVLNNCYKIILANKMDDIIAGKIKKQAAYTTFTGNGSGAPSSGKQEDTIETLSNEEKVIAARFGMSEKTWIDSKKELNYV